MGNHFAASNPRRNSLRKAILTLALTGAICAPLRSARPPARLAAPDWQNAAGGRMAFDIASVRGTPPLPQAHGIPIFLWGRATSTSRMAGTSEL